MERDAQLRTLDRILDECRATGAGGIAQVTGPVASGKTELSKVFADRARAAGAVVLETMGSLRERDLSLGVLGQLFGALPLKADRERAGRLLREYVIVPEKTSEDETDHLPTWVNQQLWTMIRRTAEQAPVVIVIDDLQFVDLPSLRTLLYFSAQLRSAPVMLVVAELHCPLSSDRGRRVLVTELLRQPGFNRLRVGPLTVAGVARWLSPAADRPVDDLTAESWWWISGGNPLLLKALVEDCRTAGIPPALGEPVVGDEFAKSVLAILHRGGSWIGRAYRGLAVLAESDSYALLPELIEDDPEATGKIIDVMNSAGILADGRFRHPAARAAVLDELPEDLNTALHRRAADLLHERDAEPERVGRHLVAAQDATRPWALDVLMAAAQQALTDDHVGFATKCLALAESAAATDEQRTAVTILRVQVEFRTNPTKAFRHLDTLTTALREDRLSAPHLISLLRPLLWRGQQSDVMAALQRLADASDSLDSRSTAELYVLREWLRSAYPSLLARVRVAAGPLSPARSEPVISDPLVRATAMLSGVLSHGPDESTVPTAEWLLQSLSLRDNTFCGIQAALQALVYADRTDLAEHWCDLLLRESTTRNVPTWRALLATTRAEVALRHGDMHGALRNGRLALRQIPTSGWGVAIGSPMSALLIASAATGDPAAAELDTVELPEAMFETRFGVQFLYARGLRQLANNRLHAALDDLLTCGRLMVDWGIDLPAFVPWRVDAVKVLLRLGRREHARGLAVEQLALPAVQQLRVRGMSLRAMAATTEDPRTRQVTLLAAIEALENCPDRVELAYALADLAETHLALGESRRARVPSQRALRIADEQHLEPLRRRLSGGDPVQVVPAARQEPHEESVTLSAAEHRVAALAATGHTNRQIAGKLYITVSTVEQHLTRAYRKLQVNGRADLASSLNSAEHRQRMAPAR